MDVYRCIYIYNNKDIAISEYYYYYYYYYQLIITIIFFTIAVMSFAFALLLNEY